MTIAQQIGDLKIAREFNDQRADFVRVVKYFALGQTGGAAAAQLAIADGAPPRVVDAIRAAVDPMSIASVGAALSPFQLLLESL